MDGDMTTLFIWLGILLCITQAGIFSGLNLALFSISRLKLEVEATSGNPDAVKILELRRDAHFLLATILWGNVAVNVLLTLLSDSVMLGVSAFVFSTVVITLFGEIFPQAYFSRNALRLGAALVPMLRFYAFILYPVAKLSALFLDRWLGKEGIQYFHEQHMREVIRQHIKSNQSDIGRIEGVGVLNFLAFDDLAVGQEGEPVASQSIITLPHLNGVPCFPHFQQSADDPFLIQINASHKKWVIILNENDEPLWVLNAHAFLRAVMFESQPVKPLDYCHRPIVISDVNRHLGTVINRFTVCAEHFADDVIDNDLILLWGEQRRVITGSDILGRLLRGIVIQELPLKG